MKTICSLNSFCVIWRCLIFYYWTNFSQYLYIVYFIYLLVVKPVLKHDKCLISCAFSFVSFVPEDVVNKLTPWIHQWWFFTNKIVDRENSLHFRWNATHCISPYAIVMCVCVSVCVCVCRVLDLRKTIWDRDAVFILNCSEWHRT